MDFDYSQVVTIKFGTFFAGLLGATITLMKRSQGSILSRFGGYISAIFSIVYVIPAAEQFLHSTTGYSLPVAGEHIVAFVFGMVANSMVESFLDDPAGSLSRWISGLKRFKKMMFNQTPVDFPSIKEDNKGNLESEKIKDKSDSRLHTSS